MQKQIFREKSLERIASPEQLDDYIRSSSPTMWILLAAIIILLAGVCVWGVFGRLETTVDTAAQSQEDGSLVCYVKEGDIASVTEGMEVRIYGQVFSVTDIASQPTSVTANFDAYALHLGEIQVGEWVYEVALDGSLPQGVYEAKIVTEQVSPMSFVFN